MFLSLAGLRSIDPDLSSARFYLTNSLHRAIRMQLDTHPHIRLLEEEAFRALFERSPLVGKTTVGPRSRVWPIREIAYDAEPLAKWLLKFLGEAEACPRALAVTCVGSLSQDLQHAEILLLLARMKPEDD